jgi:colicin import membrane protein
MATAATEILPATDIVLAVEETPQIVLLDAEKFDQFYERVKAETSGIVADISTKKGRDEIRSMAAKVTRSKTMIDKAGLALTKQWRDQTNQVNAARKEIEARLEALADEVRRPLTEWEDAEKARVERCNQVIADLKRGAVVTMDDTAADVRERGRTAYNVILSPETFGDLLPEAQAAKDATIEVLKAALVRLTKEEEDRAELERLRAADAERLAREQAEREAREAKERGEAEARAAEERRVAAEKAEQERIERAAREAEARARAEAVIKAQEERDAERRKHEEALAAERRRAEEAEAKAKAERDRIAKAEAARAEEEKRLADEQAKREADQKHRTAVKTAAKNAIMSCGADEETARKIVTLIIAGEVPHVRLEF